MYVLQVVDTVEDAINYILEKECIRWQYHLYSTRKKKTSILLWPFIVIWRAWQHVQPISFFWLVNLEAGCRLISYSFYQQIHGGDIRPYSFNLLVFLVAEGANLLFVEISKALCCGSATENLNQIPNLRHCFNFFFLLKYNLVQIQRRLSLDHIAIRPAWLLRSGPLELTAWCSNGPRNARPT